MSITPLDDREHRLPLAGRIRLGGHKQTRGPGRAIDTFRLTSQERRFLEPVAAEYGGEVKAWHDSKSPDRFEVFTKARELNVILPPNAMSEHYEFWTGDAGLLRRCDGVTCALMVPSEDGYDIEDVPCICQRRALQGKDACSYKLRLSVLLTEVETLGAWRLDTGSKYAKVTIPGMVKAIQALGGSAFTKAVLRLEQRTAPGKRFNVPVLDVKSTIGALVAGDQRLGMLPGRGRTNDAPALGPGASSDEPFLGSFEAVTPIEEDVVDAEIVEDDEHVDPMFGRAWLSNLNSRQVAKVMPRAVAIAQELGEPVPMNVAALSTNVVDKLVSEYAHLLPPKEKDASD